MKDFSELPLFTPFIEFSIIYNDLHVNFVLDSLLKLIDSKVIVDIQYYTAIIHINLYRPFHKM